MRTLTASGRPAAGPLPPHRHGWWGRPLALLLLLALAAFTSHAQLVSTYTFAKSTGTFTPLPSSTPVNALLVDTGNSPALPLGFTFHFDGVDYTSVIATSDGYLSFSPNFTSSDYGNTLATTHYSSDPLIAGLWDDLSGGNDSNSKASYITTGTAGNHVFTFEWLYWSWGYSAPTGGVSFQIKLYENGNRVEMVYRPEAGALVNPSASVGLRSVGGQGPGSFLSVSTLDNSAVASNAVAQDNLTAKPTSGLTFSFTPTPCSVPPTYATLPVSQSFETAWTDACAPHNAAGPSWRTTPLTGNDSWRRDDDGASANWTDPSTTYMPSPVASQGSHAAIFESSYAVAGSTGSLDLYVNLSTAGTKVLTFDYNNFVNAGNTNNDFLTVQLSNDGGATFPTTLLTLNGTAGTGYVNQSIVVSGTSATSVIRFKATGDYGYSNIGLDNVQLVATTCAPATNAAVSSITSTSASFTFTPSGTATSYTVTYTPSGGPAQTVSPNPTTSPVALTGLTPSTTYTVTAVSNCSGGATSAPTSTVTFTTAATTPGNDLCSNAPTLTAATTCTTVNGNLAGANAELSDGYRDVWYKFVASDTEQRIVVADPAGSTVSLVTSVYAGACPGNSTTPFYYSASTGNAFLTGLTVGQTYYVRLYDFYNSSTLTPTTGAFTICLTKPYTPAPANDLCTAPQSLTPATSCTTTTGTLGGAHVTPGLDSSDDVWYSFVASGSQHGITLVSTGSDSPYLQVYTTNCPTSSTTPIANTSGSSTTALTGLTPGATYYARVSEFYSETNYFSPAGGTFTICVTTPTAVNLIVNSPMNVSGTYDNVTVTGTGVATLTGTLTVNQSLVVQNDGVFNGNCQVVNGAGSFTVSSGATLAVCSASGIDGEVQTTGTKTFSTDATYNFVGSAANQVTGASLPTQVRALGVSNVNGTILSHGVAVAQTLTLASTGNLNVNGKTLTLLSSSVGTALVVNSSTGVVGGTVQVQRYVSNTYNTGLGYRHLSAPVATPPVSQLGTSGSPVTVNPAFNSASAAVRPTITPYPTVFYYNEANVTAGNTTADFDQGWFSPSTSSDAMPVLQGYAAQVAGAQTVTFSGTLNNGALSVGSQGYSNAGGQAGWHLLGNPYPSPLDWSTLTVGTTASNNLQNMNGAVYVAQSNGHYTGTYRSYQNGFGGDPVIASGQGFFVRTAGVGQSGTLRLSNANRVTTWSATNSTLYRTNDLRPQLYLRVAPVDPGIAPDETVVYTEAGATPATDARYDAYKLPNTGLALNLYSLANADELSINGLPELGTQVVTVPLGLRAPLAGTYIFTAAQLRNFGSATVYLRDALTNTLVNLSTTPSYTFQVSAGALASTSRFALELRPGGALATASGLSAAQVSLFPNPAHDAFTVELPALAGASTATLALYNALGQVVLSRTLPLGNAGLSTTIEVHGLATGVYSLRLTAGPGTPLVKRVVVE